MRAIAYVRVSTEEQASEGVSLEAQERAVRAYTEMRGVELVDVVVDAGVSAGKPLSDREGGRQVLEAVKRGKAEAVVSFKLDRLFRDCQDALGVTKAWDRAGAALHLVDLGGQSIDTSTAMGRFFLTVMAGAAELERNMIRERTSSAMQHMRAQHAYTGGRAPYGWALTDAGDLVENEAEQRVITEARELRASGLTLRAVAQQLAARGYRPRTGKTWHASQIRNMVKAG